MVGHDTALRTVLQDLRTGRWMSMRALLTHVNYPVDWAMWSHRTQVLGEAAAGSSVVGAWLKEEPASPAGRVMHARVLVERALRAHHCRHPRTQEMWKQAAEACLLAAHYAPADPVPWVCRLRLALMDKDQQAAVHRQVPPETTLPPGPWGLLYEATARDLYNREAHHQMMSFLATRTGGSWGQANLFVQWVMERTPEGSALLVLPLYVRTALWRQRRSPGGHLDVAWVDERARREAMWGLLNWFQLSQPSSRSLLDLNHLAHALWAARLYAEAGTVFEAMGPYATTRPWEYHTDKRVRPPEYVATEWFVRARNQCRNASPSALRASVRC
ncbi:hypothetical protein [Streptomyces botrytidirepellens]|nr:hypothetical protein [Streptomyces botrytidirepellens]